MSHATDDRPKFTLGPWRLLDRNTVVHDADDRGAHEIAWSDADYRLVATAPELREALMELVAIIDKAGLLHLAHGVQLGATSWYVKASDRLEYARRVLAKAEGRAS